MKSMKMLTSANMDTSVPVSIPPLKQTNKHENANVINSEFRYINRKGKINIRTPKKKKANLKSDFCGL
mgnify:CR=1 FL=1